jgi:hypothetical protein
MGRYSKLDIATRLRAILAGSGSECLPDRTTRSVRRLPRLTEPEIAELVALRQAGEQIAVLAERFGVGRNTVLAHLKRRDVPGRRWHGRTLGAEQLHEAGQLYDSGANLIAVAERFGVDRRYLVAHNVVDDNLSECGIVLPSHSSNAVTFDPTTFKVTSVNPTQGGVYGNVVRDNIADGNGTDLAPPQFGGGGSGSGLGLFGSGPGSAVYNNFIVDNEASGNGLAGLTMHAHHPGGEDIDGNVIVHNDFGTNNLGGDGFDGPPVTDFQTTGIAIFSVPTTHMVIADNKIHDDAIGVWLSTTVSAAGLRFNHFKHVGTNVVTG